MEALANVDKKHRHKQNQTAIILLRFPPPKYPISQPSLTPVFAGKTNWQQNSAQDMSLTRMAVISQEFSVLYNLERTQSLFSTSLKNKRLISHCKAENERYFHYF